MVLAGAVSGMHWCAAVGTSYTLLHNTPGMGVSRKDAMVVVICLVNIFANIWGRGASNESCLKAPKLTEPHGSLSLLVLS